MKFKNNGESVQVRIKEKSLFGGEGCRWTCVKKGEIVDLPESVGLINGLEKVTVTEGEIGKTKVETKQIETDKKTDKIEYTPDDSFLKELCFINGIGEKTAEDIVTWGTKEKLIEVIAKGGNLPFRDDVARLLEVNYGC